MAHIKHCPYCGQGHKLVSAFKRCERAHRRETWKKSPK